jgi:hypothetical protein
MERDHAWGTGFGKSTALQGQGMKFFAEGDKRIDFEERNPYERHLIPPANRFLIEINQLPPTRRQLIVI